MTRAELETLNIHELRSRATYLEMPRNHLIKYFEGAYSYNKREIWVNALADWEKQSSARKELALV